MNKCIFTGRLGRAPELRFTTTGTAVVNFNLAVNGYRGGEKVTDWFHCSIFGDRAERFAEYAGIGDLIGVEGKAQTRSWEDKDGGKHDVVEFVVDTWDLLSRSPNSTKGEASDNTSEEPF